MIRKFFRWGFTSLLILTTPYFAYGFTHDFNLWTSHSEAGIGGGLIMAALAAVQFGVLVFIPTGVFGVLRTWQPQNSAGRRCKPYMLAALAGIAAYMLIFAFESLAFQNGYHALYLLLSWHEQALMALRNLAETGFHCCLAQPDFLDWPLKLSFGAAVYAVVYTGVVTVTRHRAL